jgi:hypothetical protein
MTFLAGQVIILAAFSVLLGPSAAAIVRMVPANVRVTTVSLGTNLSVAAMQTLTPLAMLYLVNAVSPAPLGASVFILAGALVTVAAILRLRKQLTAPILRVEEPSASVV